MDAAALGQVLINLLLNATQAITEAKTPQAAITVSVRREGGDAVIAVCDTGPGIEASILERIFEPSFSTRATGSGLGLTIARELTEQHGGRLTAHSDPGRRTTLELRLPAL